MTCTSVMSPKRHIFFFLSSCIYLPASIGRGHSHRRSGFCREGRAELVILSSINMTVIGLCLTAVRRRRGYVGVLLVVALAVSMLGLLCIAEGERVNATSDSSAAAAIVDDHDPLDGGFSSLDGMLQWAIGHSDPVKLKESAEDVQHMSPSDLEKRRLEIQDLASKMKMPSDSQLMHIAINDLKNSSLSLDDRLRALEELLVLVEPIDNAKDLSKLGGLSIVIEQLDHPDADIRALSAWVLGKASQNNPDVQEQALEIGALTRLMKMVRSTYVDEANKALYTVSALIRNNLAGQKLFYSEAGVMLLQDIMSSSSSDIRLHKKALFLVADLVECQADYNDLSELPFIRDHFFLKFIVDLTASTDLDLQEKALVAIKSLLQFHTTEALIFEDFCGLDDALNRMRLQLQDMMGEEHHKDYAMDVESLRQEVELIFHRRRGNVGKAASPAIV